MTPIDPPATAEADARLNELELKFMDQQATLEELSSALYAQQRTIDALNARVQLLEKKLAGEPGLVDATANEKPPHY